MWTILRIQDTNLLGADDPSILAFAAEEGRILLTHDVRTMNNYAYGRVRENLPMPGVFQVEKRMPIGQAIHELLLAIDASKPEEWENRVIHFPL